MAAAGPATATPADSAAVRQERFATLHSPATYQMPIAAVSRGHLGFQSAAAPTRAIPAPAKSARRRGRASSPTISRTPPQNKRSVNGSERTSVMLRSYVNPGAKSAASAGTIANELPAAFDAKRAAQSAAAVP